MSKNYSETFLAIYESTNLPREICELICKMVFIIRVNKFKMDNFSILFTFYKMPMWCKDYKDSINPISNGRKKYAESVKIFAEKLTKEENKKRDEEFLKAFNKRLNDSIHSDYPYRYKYKYTEIE